MTNRLLNLSYLTASLVFFWNISDIKMPKLLCKLVINAISTLIDSLLIKNKWKIKPIFKCACRTCKIAPRILIAIFIWVIKNSCQFFKFITSDILFNIWTDIFVYFFYGEILIDTLFVLFCRMWLYKNSISTRKRWKLMGKFSIKQPISF